MLAILLPKTIGEKFNLSNKLLYAVLFLLIVLFAASCKEDPTSAGLNLIPDEDFINADTLNSYTDSLEQTSKTFYKEILLGPASTLILGKFNGVESNVLVSYNYVGITSQLKNDLLNDSVIARSAWIDIIPSFKLGDTLTSFDLSLHKINSGWTSSSFNSDSLNLLNYDSEDIINEKTFSDTLIKLTINAGVPFKWLQKLADDEVEDNNGILFLPGAGVNKFIGFPAYPNQISNVLHLVVEKPGSYIDTLEFNAAFDIHVVKGTPLQPGNEIEYLQAGFATRMKLQFDLDNVLPAGVIVNKAELQLTVDDNFTINGYPASDTLFVTMLGDESDTLEIADYGGYMYREGDKFKGNFNAITQSWLNGVSNFGLQIYLRDELNSLSKIAIKSSRSADLADRPKLRIIYTHK